MSELNTSDPIPHDHIMGIVEHTAVFHLDQHIDILFPLFSPEGEKLWEPGWNYENIMGSTQLHEDYIFLTTNHDHNSTKAVWLVKRYDPDSYFVQFYKVDPGDKVGVVTVQCMADGPERTSIEVTYKYTGLSEQGNPFVRSFNKDQYMEFIGEWNTLLTTYFTKQTGVS